MTKIVDLRIRHDQELLIRCTCGAGEFVSFSAWEPFEEGEYFLSIMSTWRTPRGTWGRIRAAWHLFWKGEYCSAEVTLNADDLLAISQWCGNLLIATRESRKSGPPEQYT